MPNLTRASSIGIVTFGCLLAIVCSCAQTAHQFENHTEDIGLGRRYHVVHGWPVLPEGEMLGEVVGVGVDSHDDVFVFHRGDREWPDDGDLDVTPIDAPTIVLFDGQTGVVKSRWGAGKFAMPHGLTIDRQDHLWLTDVALQQVYEFTHDGELLMTLGERGVSGDDSSHFNRPTDVAIAPDGSFYVSDGYLNTRVMKFSPQGKFLFQWGTKGTGPGEFDLPHGLALDTAGRVYVSDRGNARIQVFDGNGKYLSEWKNPQIGRPYDLAFGPNGLIFIVDGGDQPESGLDRSGVAIVHADGSLAGRFGRFGYYDGQFYIAHGIDVARDGSVYVGDVKGKRIQKFVFSKN